MSIIIRTLLLALLMQLFVPVRSQQYTTTAGIRVGRSFGLTVNQRIARKYSIEGILQTNFADQSTVHGLLRRHHSLITRRLNVYYGGGLHTGSTTGIDGILGVETTLARMNLSFDVKPVINATGAEALNVFQFQAAASIRYVVFKSGNAKKKQRQRKRQKRQRQREKDRRNRS